MTPIVLTKVTSSQIHAIGYDPNTATLAIQFKRDGKPGPIYHYANFSQGDWEFFASAESIGSHFYKHIKYATDRFPYTKISD